MSNDIYLQCDPHDDIGSSPDDRTWARLEAALAFPDWRLDEDPIDQKSIIGLRSFVCDPMLHDQLFIAGNAGHIMPPTSAKGLNHAAADLLALSCAFEACYKPNLTEGLARYSETSCGKYRFTSVFPSI